jgi:hypothetical protein
MVELIPLSAAKAGSHDKKEIIYYRMKKLYNLTLLISLTFFEVTAQKPQEFFIDDWKAKTATIPEYIHSPHPIGPVSVIVTIDMNDTITKVNQYIYGHNAIPWAGKMNNDAAMVKNIAVLSPNILRWPGGNLSNEHFWDAVQDKGPKDIPPTLQINPLNAGMNTSNWAMTTNDYYDLLKKTNSTGCICVNYSYARYGTGPDPVANAAHYAANWVRYDNGRTKFWEIGNENMGPWQAGYEIDTTLNQDGQPQFISGELYGKHCRVFIDSMKVAAAEIGSKIYIGVVVMESLVTYNSIMNKWNSGVMPQVADKADFLIAHSYYTPYDQNSNVATILNSTMHTKKIKDYVLNDLKNYGKMDNLPIALTEWNIFATGSGQAVSYINGMHATLNLGELIKNQYGAAMRWDLANGWNNGNDHGIFARNDEPGVTPGTPHAPFFYMYYFQKYFGDIMVGSTVTGSSNIVSYASSFSSGESGLVVVNKGTTKQIVNLKANNLHEARSYYRFVLTGGTDNGNFSRKVFVNGEGTSQAGGGPANYDAIKAYGNSIIDSIKFEVPPLSVTYLLVSNDSISGTTGIQKFNNQDLKIYPNPTNGEITICNNGFYYNRLSVINITGEIVFEKVFDQAVGENMQYRFNLNSGIYILNLSNGNQQLSKKLIIK